MKGCEFVLFQGKNSSSGKKICFSLIMFLSILLELTSITADGIYFKNGDKVYIFIIRFYQLFL